MVCRCFICCASEYAQPHRWRANNGWRISYCYSTKQKLKTRSSTESELVGVDDMMPIVVWSRYFLMAQGYGVTQNLLLQDNKSSMLLEKNGSVRTVMQM